MPDTYLIVYNARPGSRAQVAAPVLARALEARGARPELWATSPGTAGMDSIDPSRYRGILVIGGDGTFHFALNGIRPSQVPFGFLGTGTVNVLSRELGIPREPATFAEVVLAGRTAAVPCFRANGRRCALFLESGFLGAIVARTNALREARGTHGQMEYIVAALGVLPRSWGRPVRVTLRLQGGSTVERSYSDVLLTRARLYAGRVSMPIEHGVQEPLLEPSFLSFGYRTRTPIGHLVVLAIGFLGLLPRFRAPLERLGFIECRRAVAARIEGPSSTGSHVDAETFGSLPIEVETETPGFALFVP